MKINAHYLQLKETYLFTNVAAKARAFALANPEADIIKLSIGDVTRPLVPTAVRAMMAATEEMGHTETFRGYGPEQGYEFLREAIRGYYADRGVTLAANEIFISDGIKCDIGNVLDIFATENAALVPDPVYPVYVDANRMADRRVVHMHGSVENGFLPMPDEEMLGDIIYLCSPNNPTGAAYSREQLQEWVDFANRREAILLFDAAYEAFIGDELHPHSIFELEGARNCAIEFASFSKTAGFTGLRCGYTVIPEELEREGVKLRKLWLRRETAKFNGVAYPVQRAAEAALTPEGLSECRANIAYYKENARMICELLTRRGIQYTGGKHSPYIWMQCPNGMRSWEFFDLLLERAHVVGTPGVGFGDNGEGWMRLTAFNSHERTEAAVARMDALLGALS